MAAGVRRWIWFALGCAAFLAIRWLVWGPVRRVSERSGGAVAHVYRSVAGLLTVLWCGYPILWALGPSGVGLLTQPPETLGFVLLPIVSKVGWSIVNLSPLRRLAPTAAASSAPA